MEADHGQLRLYRGLAPLAYQGARSLVTRQGDSSVAGDGLGDSGAVPYALNVLAHPIRHRLLGLLAERGELGVPVLRQELSLSKPAIAYHTKLLLGADLIEVRRQGRSILYTLRRAAVAALRDELALLARPPRTDDGTANPRA